MISWNGGSGCLPIQAVLFRDKDDLATTIRNLQGMLDAIEGGEVELTVPYCYAEFAEDDGLTEDERDELMDTAKRVTAEQLLRQ